MENNNQQSPVDQQPPQPVQQPSVPPSTSPKPKLPLFILIVFIIFIIIGGGIYLSKISNLKNQTSNPQLKSQNLTPTQISNLSPVPTTDETASPAPNGIGANWKTYTNKRYGIAFQYPVDWTVSERDVKNTENRGELGTPDILDLRSEFNETYSPITLLIYDKINNLSLEKFQEELRSELIGDSIPLWSKSDIQMVNSNGITIYYGNEKYCGSYECHRYSWKGNNKIFELILYRDYIATYNQILDQIIQTFKFTQ